MSCSATRFSNTLVADWIRLFEGKGPKTHVYAYSVKCARIVSKAVKLMVLHLKSGLIEIDRNDWVASRIQNRCETLGPTGSWLAAAELD